MAERLHLAVAVLLAATLAGCAGGGAAVPLPSASTRPAPGTMPRSPPDPAGAVPKGADPAGVIGADAAMLRARFGKPRIDLVEAEARKLQFAGAHCVVDIYLYPLGAGDPPVATHVEARRREGGGAIPHEVCLSAIGAGR